MKKTMICDDCGKSRMCLVCDNCSISSCEKCYNEDNYKFYRIDRALLCDDCVGHEIVDFDDIEED